MGQKPGAETKTIQKSEPWAEQKPYYLDLYNRAAGALDQTQGRMYTGDFIAQPGQGMFDALSAGRSVIPNLSAGAGALSDLATKTAQGAFLNPSNPILVDAMRAAASPAQQTFENSVLPAIRSQAISQGAYGGASQDFQENAAASDLTRNINDMTSRMMMDFYTRERGYQQDAGKLMGQANTLMLQPAQTAFQIGGMEQGLQQQSIDNALARFREELAAPWRGLSDTSGILGAGGFGTTTGTSTGPPTSQLGGLIQGGLGGASAGAGLAMLTGSAAMPWMLPLALAGGAAGFFT